VSRHDKLWRCDHPGASITLLLSKPISHRLFMLRDESKTDGPSQEYEVRVEGKERRSTDKTLNRQKKESVRGTMAAAASSTRSRERERADVTVQLRLSRSCAIGQPTMFERPMTTA
jgi:hypothetical protein